MVEATLTIAAFGERPGHWPLPTATTARQLWLRAVAAGGQGRFGSARTDLAALLRRAPAGPLASLAHSTQASFLRQLGWHQLARGWDGSALVLAGGDAEAGADALTGLAADALGVGRYTVAAALLDRAGETLDPSAAPLPYRLAVRRSWVAAELAMALGDGADALHHAERSVALAQAAGANSVRHRVKSETVLAAALCCSGAIDRARAVGDATLDTARRFGLAPLCWALACLLAGIGSRMRTPQEVGEMRDGCAELLRHRGGVWPPQRWPSASDVASLSAASAYPRQ
jgi:hypothetical protein